LDPDPDPGSQNLADPTEPDLDPKHSFWGNMTLFKEGGGRGNFSRKYAPLYTKPDA